MVRQSLFVLLCAATCASAANKLYTKRCERIERGTTQLCRAAERGDIWTVRSLLAECPQLANGRELTGWSPLRSAVCGGHRAVVDVLLRSGADPSLADSAGTTALHDAVATRSGQIARRLLDAGVDINAANVTGDTPLHIAARLGYGELVGMLLSRGANPDARNKVGRTAADLSGAWEADDRARDGSHAISGT